MVQVPPPFSARVEIKCGQLVLPEYVDESLSDDPLHITRYVECQPDRQFEIQVALDEGFVFQGSDAVVSCYIDGEYISRVPCSATSATREEWQLSEART